MEECRATLEEHARWNQIVREASSFLDSGGRLTDCADRIETLYNSLSILQNMPGHDEREGSCTKLTEKLLSNVAPRIRADMMSDNLTPLRDYLYVYEKLGRGADLEKEYIETRPKRLEGIWGSYMQSDGFDRWLPGFMDQVSGFFSEEALNCAQLFGDDRSRRILALILEEIFSPIQGDFAKRMQMSKSPEQCIGAFETVDRFAKAFAPLLADCDANTMVRALSVIYGGCTTYMDVYAEFEGEYLKNELNAALDEVSFDKLRANAGDDMFGQADPIETYSLFAEKLVEAADTVYEPSEKIISRSVDFVGGLRVKPTLRNMAATIAAFTKKISGRIDELRVASGFPPERSATSSRSGGKTSPMPGETQSEPAIAAVDVKHKVAQNWARVLEAQDVPMRALVPAALRCLQAAGRLAKRLRELDAATVSFLADLAETLNPLRSSGSSTPFDVLVFNAVGSPQHIFTVYANYMLAGNPSMATELKSFFSAASSRHVTQTVLAPVISPLSHLKSAAGALLFDLCISTPEKITSVMAGDDVWSSEDNNAGGSDLYQMDLMPQPSFTQIGEHLLSLVQELEIFASSDALPDLLSLSGEAAQLALASRGWRLLKENLDISNDEAAGMDMLCKRPSCLAAVSAVETAAFGATVSLSPEDLAEMGDPSGGRGNSAIMTEELGMHSGSLRYTHHFVHIFLHAHMRTKIEKKSRGILIYAHTYLDIFPLSWQCHSF